MRSRDIRFISIIKNTQFDISVACSDIIKSNYDMKQHNPMTEYPNITISHIVCHYGYSIPFPVIVILFIIINMTPG